MDWKTELRCRVTTVDELDVVMPMDAQTRASVASVLEQRPFSINPYYLNLIDFSQEQDPIRKIAVPSFEELDIAGDLDTSGEAGNTVVRGLQHKYAQTALMLSTSECAMYCRHCFRRRLVGRTEDEVVSDLEVVYNYLMAHREIVNVLVSGGDALMNSNERLDEILGMLIEIDHLNFIRIATRMPVVLPSRVSGDSELLDMLAGYAARKQLIVVTQFDHPREVTPDAADAVKALRQAGIPVLNQTVLLRGVNDDVETLSRLLRNLTTVGAIPYYVFQCRPVSGVKQRFQVPFERGIEVVEGAKALQAGPAKALRYCLSHVTGKIEIVGKLEDGKMLFKYHEAKDATDLGRLFSLEMTEGQAWLD
ncbi:MAG: KamA family radical SAM protein [Gordonibacter sp.]|nr:KamA family radical SAM protein [Gordonibacter sp.]